MIDRRLTLATAIPAWSIVCGVIGWELRHSRADTQAARAEAIETVRAAEHTSAQHSAKTERERVSATARNEVVFRVIERKVAEYVDANPDNAGCDLDGDGLHAWREANAGRLDAESDHSPSSDGALSSDDATATQQQP